MTLKDKQKDTLLKRIKDEQFESGYVSEESMVRIAKNLNLSVSEVYGVTTFYSFLSTKPLGRHVIRVCKSVPCCLKDAELIIDWIKETLGISPGETTSDGRFTFELTNCIGACDSAPAILIDDKTYGDLTIDSISELFKSFD